MKPLLLLCLLAAGCAHYAGIAVAPNGVVWVARNASGAFGSPRAEGVFACVPRGPQLDCTRVATTGME